MLHWCKQKNPCVPNYSSLRFCLTDCSLFLGRVLIEILLSALLEENRAFGLLKMFNQSKDYKCRGFLRFFVRLTIDKDVIENEVPKNFKFMSKSIKYL